MRLFLPFVLLLLSASSFSQSLYITMQNDTVQELATVYKGTKRLFLFLNSNSCTGCKDDLNRFLERIDTNSHKIIIVRQLPLNSFQLKHQLKMDVNYFFNRYNMLLFELTTEKSKTPFISLIDQENCEIQMEYLQLYDGMSLSRESKEKLETYFEIQ